jgi:hypothetical protein
MDTFEVVMGVLIESGMGKVPDIGLPLVFSALAKEPCLSPLFASPSTVEEDVECDLHNMLVCGMLQAAPMYYAITPKLLDTYNKRLIGSATRTLLRLAGKMFQELVKGVSDDLG